ncbi:hypothetical protein DPMN_007417 [Dreissena polymorpha]|uniref:Secreted protein n=1 Tax=Dreissena polymorpha TaxID=45954 RepID=A0A9D4MUA4_DREPO|nr:hypothetical protein DPMN_007417 [Dreissena polymorpha]
MRITSVFLMLIFRPVFSASSACRVSFDCACCCLWGRRLMSSAKSRSSRCLVKVHWMPVLLPSVVLLMIQSMMIRKIVGESIQPCLTPVFTAKGSVSFPL